MLNPGEGRRLKKNFNHVILCVYTGCPTLYLNVKILEAYGKDKPGKKVLWIFARFTFLLLEKNRKRQKQKVFNFLTYLISLFDSLINSGDQTVTVVHQTSSEQCLVTIRCNNFFIKQMIKMIIYDTNDKIPDK